MQRNLVIQQTENQPIEIPPQNSDLGSITSWTADMDQSTDTMNALCTPDAVPTSLVAIVEGTPQISAGRSQPKNKYKRITQIGEGGNLLLNYQPAWSLIFGNVTAGLRVFLRIRLIHTTTGATTVPVHFSMVTI
jgi:hypothetical protein